MTVGLDIGSARRQREREQATFTPTADWKDVPDDAILPRGLQIKVDMESGTRRARIPPQDGNGQRQPPGMTILEIRCRHCLDRDGKIDRRALRWAQEIGSYTELCREIKGIRIYVEAELPEGRVDFSPVDSGWSIVPLSAPPQLNGSRIEGAPDKICRGQAGVNKLISALTAGRSKGAPEPRQEDEPSPPGDGSDEQLEARAPGGSGAFNPEAYAEEVKQAREKQRVGARRGPPAAAQDKPSPKMLAADEIKPKRTNWMWHPYMPAGVISLLGAKGGSCKGLTCASLTATVTTGGLWPDGSGRTEPGNVLWCEAEDPLPEVVVPRLLAAGADRSRVTFASREAFAAVGALRDFITRKAISLIIQSPMVSFLELTDINSELGVRDVLERMQASIEGLDCGVLGIVHTNKKADLAAVERLLGSVAFANFVRSVMLTASENVEDRTFRLVHAKHNLSTKGDDLILKPVHVGEDSRDQYVKLQWSRPENGNCDAEALFDRKKNGKDKEPTAGAWLAAYLRGHGESPREVVIVEGEKAGYTARALEASMMRAPNLHSRREFKPSRSWWSLA